MRSEAALELPALPKAHPCFPVKLSKWDLAGWTCSPWHGATSHPVPHHFQIIKLFLSNPISHVSMEQTMGYLSRRLRIHFLMSRASLGRGRQTGSCSCHGTALKTQIICHKFHVFSISKDFSPLLAG